MVFVVPLKPAERKRVDEMKKDSSSIKSVQASRLRRCAHAAIAAAVAVSTVAGAAMPALARNAESFGGFYTYVYTDGNPWEDPTYTSYDNKGNVVDRGTRKQQIVYRLYNPYDGQHLFMSPAFSYDEYVAMTRAGWQDEGPAFEMKTKVASSSPVYRLYNPYSGEHHYTASTAEYDACERVGWRKEGVAWYADEDKTTPVYRLYNPYASVGTHHYTTDKSEVKSLVAAGWRDEGVAFYGTAENWAYN